MFTYRNGKYFEPILNYLRTGQLIYDKNLNPLGILEEAKFFGLDELIHQLQPIVARECDSYSNIEPLTRQEVIHALIQTSHNAELRFQGKISTKFNFSLIFHNSRSKSSRR